MKSVMLFNSNERLFTEYISMSSFVDLPMVAIVAKKFYGYSEFGNITHEEQIKSITDVTALHLVRFNHIKDQALLINQTIYFNNKTLFKDWDMTMDFSIHEGCMNMKKYY